VIPMIELHALDEGVETEVEP